MGALPTTCSLTHSLTCLGGWLQWFCRLRAWLGVLFKAKRSPGTPTRKCSLTQMALKHMRDARPHSQSENANYSVLMCSGCGRSEQPRTPADGAGKWVFSHLTSGSVNWNSACWGAAGSTWWNDKCMCSLAQESSCNNLPNLHWLPPQTTFVRGYSLPHYL